MYGKSWPRLVIARVKGALHAGLTHKVISQLSGIPIDTITNWSRGGAHSGVAPERFPVELLENWLKGRE